MSILSDGNIGHGLMSIDETHEQFIHCWLITFLIWFRALSDSEETLHSNTSREKDANSIWAAWDRIRAGDNDDRLQHRFGEGFSIAWSGFERPETTSSTTVRRAARVSGRELGVVCVWYLG